MTGWQTQDLTFTDPIHLHANGVSTRGKFYPWQFYSFTGQDSFIPPPNVRVFIRAIRLFAYRNAADTGTEILCTVSDNSGGATLIYYHFPPAGTDQELFKNFTSYDFLASPGWHFGVTLTGTFDSVHIDYQVALIPVDTSPDTLTRNEEVFLSALPREYRLFDYDGNPR